jgi:hypothetical protein
MPWARIDDAFDDHPKVLALLEHDQGGAAVGLWTLCLTWAHRNTLRKGKTPGLIPTSLPRRYLGPGARELAALLVKEGLWEPLDEGAGWMIHDFGKYLPTEKTREARAAAGRRGAARRWGKTPEDDPEPRDDGNLPSSHDNEPDVSHDVAGKPMASDGSRAPARRAISNEIAPIPIPVPPSAGGTDAPTAQSILASFIDWDRTNGGQLTKRTTGQLARYIHDLLDQGVSDRYIRRGLAEWRASGQNPATLDSFVNAAMNGAAGRAPSSRGRHSAGSTGAERAQAAVQAGEEVQGLIDRGELSL